MDPAMTFRDGLIAAIPTPRDSSGGVALAAFRSLVESLGRSRAMGLALGVWPDREIGDDLDRSRRIFATARALLSTSRALVVSVGAPTEIRRPPEVFEAVLRQARMAAEEGADVLLALPPTSLRGRPERDRIVLEYHSALAEVGRPILVSYRRETMGGIAYGPDVLAQLLARPEILGLVIGTIDGITTFQQVEALAREHAPTKLVISGEERFLGYSLMCGADAALVGVGAIEPDLVAELLEAHASGDARRFLERSGEIDALARPIFRPPLEGSSSRLLRALIDRGRLSLED